MTYPSPELLPQLQPITGDAYQQLIAAVPFWRDGENGPAPAPDDPAWTLLPTYIYAVCPFCQAVLRDRINTASLIGWGYRQSIVRVPYISVGHEEPPPFPQCSHALGVEVFVNLHGQPAAPAGFTNWNSEVPFLMPWVLADPAIPGAAVLRALPICRPHDGAFIPTWTVFFVSYFSRDPAALRMAYWQEEAARHGDDPEWYPTYFDVRRRNAVHPEPFDRAGWIATGQVGWLDHTEPALPLRIGPGLMAPALYATIAGRRYDGTVETAVITQGAAGRSPAARPPQRFVPRSWRKPGDLTGSVPPAASSPPARTPEGEDDHA